MTTNRPDPFIEVNSGYLTNVWYDSETDSYTLANEPETNPKKISVIIQSKTIEEGRIKFVELMDNMDFILSGNKYN